MARLFMTTLVLVVVCLCSSPFARAQVDNRPFEFLKVPGPDFVNSLKSTMDILREVSSVVGKVGNVFGDFRLSNAVSDCADLLDLSSDELDWSLAASEKPNGKNNSTGNTGNDLRTWLSAALVNQDTCNEGFDGSNSIVKRVIAGSLTQFTSSIRNVLIQVNPTPIKGGSIGGGGGGGGKGGGRKLMSNNNDFPHWFKSKDRKLLQGANGAGADVVVANDGSGDFKSITEALTAAPNLSIKRFVIYIKKGVYNEYVEVSKHKWNIMMIGDGVDATIVTGNRNVIDGWTTYRSATFAVKGRGFLARDITFENTAGPEKHQAVAYRSDSDLSVLYRCAFRGFQDTLYVHAMRQFFRDCIITGTVDFIFGDGTVVFQNCQILARKGLPSQKNTITAHGRKDPSEPTGFSIQFSNISADSDLLSSVNTTETYLGRPWKLYSRTVIMRSFISDAIRPEGWLEWNGNYALDTLYYGEYMNNGPGAGLGGRIKWPGYHLINDTAQANNFTVNEFLMGELWLPSTGVKYIGGSAIV